jgi:hypothetical protein
LIKIYPKGCKNLSEGLFKIGNNYEQHDIGDEVFRGIASILTKLFRVTCKYTLSIITSHILFALGVPAHNSRVQGSQVI